MNRAERRGNQTHPRRPVTQPGGTVVRLEGSMFHGRQRILPEVRPLITLTLPDEHEYAAVEYVYDAERSEGGQPVYRVRKFIRRPVTGPTRKPLVFDAGQ